MCHVAWAEKSSVDEMMRTPTFRQRSKQIQQVLVEAAINQGPSTEGSVRFSCRFGNGQCNISAVEVSSVF